jgi:hypothetical protein
MQVQIRLDIDTGSGNYAIAGNAGTLSSTFQPLLDIAFSGQRIDDLDRIETRKLDPSV